ncbi:MarR family winged helix-turn-helix transcriptional regulator [Luteipulveratus sp. YIM 133132]|uniref:MarR family winged helix-turn-helix transcriptional regulator n=1 Tax=Luteipulveratus flavus TaxID=3031728 RepID=UPI0023B03739|nr:MarR family winged helix-turn-helix transcriptional regulator [Luteipulveratus sp. YIM 133132]MDE9367259.1 MarR family winged helix-turn-helix transcriptional regulator [Luteipulveratus sp. YIM 133132]
MAYDDLPFRMLAASNAMTEAIDAGVRAAGYPDLRPAHGFAFVRLSGPGCTLVELADHMGMTKQSASTLVADLERKGYVRRSPHPVDGRATMLTLTPRGVAATEAASRAGRDVVRRWAREVGDERLEVFAQVAAAMAREGRVRPTW